MIIIHRNNHRIFLVKVGMLLYQPINLFDVPFGTQWYPINQYAFIYVYNWNLWCFPNRINLCLSSDNLGHKSAWIDQIICVISWEYYRWISITDDIFHYLCQYFCQGWSYQLINISKTSHWRRFSLSEGFLLGCNTSIMVDEWICLIYTLSGIIVMW